MGGQNPFLKSTTAGRPTKPYTITFLPDGVKVDVNPDEIPYSRDGLPGSVLEVALGPRRADRPRLRRRRRLLDVPRHRARRLRHDAGPRRRTRKTSSTTRAA
jgi:hypothetical protein